MPYNIVVCVKQVPDPGCLNKVSLDPVKKTIVREGIPSVVNPGDKNAVEEALKIKERFSGNVIVLTMGPSQARTALEEVLAMGADEAYLLCDRAFSGADSLATARVLAYGIRKLPHFDLILCGDATVDSGTGQVAVQLAELLDLPCVTNVEEVVFENTGNLVVKRKWERGHIKARLKIPAVLAVTERINEPRLPDILGIMAATRKEIPTWTAADIGVDINQVGACGSPTRVLEISEFHARRQGEILQGPAEKAVAAAIEKLISRELL